MSAGTLVLAVPAAPGDVAARLRDPGAIPGVRVDGGHSHWELAFRGRPMRWTQADRADRAEGGARLVSGDLSTLDVAWRVEPRDGGATVHLECDVTTSMAHLAGAIDPMVLRVLLRTLRAAAEGAAGAEAAGVVERGGELLADPVRTGPGS